MIVLKQLNYSVGKCLLLQGIDLSIEAGKLVAIVGPNGAGKSTFLKVLGQEICADYVQFSFKNQEMCMFAKSELPFHRAKFSQHHAQEIHLPIDDVVMMGRYPYFDHEPTELDREVVRKCMQQTETEPLIDRAYEQLSGGEKQRLHLARVLAQLENEVENKLLLLDEPLNNLDVAHQFKTLQLIRSFVENGNTALVVLHDLNMAAQFADEVILLHRGQCVAQGTPKEVLEVSLLEKIYDYPCSVVEHPKNKQPMILFG